MGLFSRKKKVDYDALFKDEYKSINQLTIQAHDELDFVVKESLYALVVEKYDHLLNLIEQGANFEKDHFMALKENAVKELKSIQDINKD